MVGGTCLAFVSMLVAGGWAFLVVLTLALGGGLWLQSASRKNARAQCFPDCACPWQAVSYLGWNGTRESFAFAQNGYGVEFMLANLKKVVSVSPDGQEILRAHVHRMELEAAAAHEADTHRRRLEAEQADAKRRALMAEREAELQRLRHQADLARDDAEFAKAVSRMEAAKGPSGRRGGLDAGLRALKQPHLRERLLLEASRIEVQAALEKAEGLKSPAAKVRTLRAALDAIRNDPVPDELQAQQIRWLEEAISQVEDEKNSIDEV